MVKDRSFRLRDANSADANAIALLHATSWKDAYSNVLDRAFLSGPVEDDRFRHWQSELAITDAKRRIILAIEEELPVGFICARWPVDSAWGVWVDNLHVSRLSRGKGFGRNLLRAAADWASRVDSQAGLHLWVFEANQPALAFYRHLGGAVVDRRSSRIPAAHGAPIICLWWRCAADLARAEIR